MPSKLLRLKKRTDFLRISGKRCSNVCAGFIIQADVTPKPKNSLNVIKPAPRVGFTVSKKVGNAVKRNFVKRRLRALADNLIRDEFYNGLDYVIIGRKEAIVMPFAVLKSDFQKSLKIVSKKVKDNM
ncbi:MAG: ribonuclease P protein component [Alphaproteobacteria bacterium]